MNAAAKHKLRWFQFSLRSALLLTLLCAIACSWFVVKKQQADRQRETVNAIEKAGGLVKYDFEYDVNYRRLKGAKPPGPTWLQNLLGVDFFSDVHCVQWCAFDEEVVHLSALTNLRMLYLGAGEPEPDIVDDGGQWWNNNTFVEESVIQVEGEFTDAGLDHLEGLAQLELLDLGGREVTDAGLERLKRFRDLKWLNLNGTQVSSAGLEHLKEMKWLESVSLERTKVDDVGLEHLEGLPNLKRLYVEDTRVTDKGVKSLQQALPNCKIGH